MTTVDQIQRLCEEYIGRKFGKRDKKDLSEFLRGLQAQRAGDSDNEQEPQRAEFTRTPTKPSSQQVSVETPTVVKDSAAIVKKASAFLGSVAETYLTSPRTTPVKVSDFDDVEEVKARKAKWEEGQVAGAEGIKQPADGYKVETTEEVRARKEKWEGGQVATAEGTKQPVDGYKLEDTEEVKARKAKWEEGGPLNAEGTKASPADGYKLSESVGVKDRLNKWSEVSSVPTIAKAPREVPLVEDADSALMSPRTRDRAKQWEEGQVGRAESSTKSPVKVAEEEGVPAVKDRLNKWSEVTKEPETPTGRKEPLKIYDDQQ